MKPVLPVSRFGTTRSSSADGAGLAPEAPIGIMGSHRSVGSPFLVGVARYDRPVDPTPELIIWDARLIDGRGAPPLDHAVVRVRDGQIEAIEQVAGRDAAPGAVDLAGRSLLPGLIDAH